MILYFSGTGNSRYVAEYLAEGLEEERISLIEAFRKKDFSSVYSERPWIIVAPTYGWRIPRILEDYIRRTDFLGNKDIYFVMTCGQDNGKAGAYLARLCDGVNLHYRGCAEIVMPENYIAMFPVPTQEESVQIIEESEEGLQDILNRMKAGKDLEEKKTNLLDAVKSGVVNELFYKLFVKANRFYVTETCISCGKCAEVCPLNNISLHGGKPVWGEECTHCMSCICGCPREAIEYGKSTIGKRRYQCPDIEKTSRM